MSGLLKPTKGEIFFEDYKYSLLLEEKLTKYEQKFWLYFSKVTFNWSLECKTKH